MTRGLPDGPLPGLPDLPAGVVPRPRVTRRILQALAGRPVLVVAASAGAGKTTAVLQAARSLPGPAAWIPLGGLATGDLASEALRGRLARAVPATGTGSLVVDGLEHIAGRAAAEDALSALVLQPPPRLRLVLVTRADPPEGIAGLGDVHRVAFLDDADLAFDVSEAARALRPAGLEEQAHFRVRAMKGWVTGVLHDWWATDPAAGRLDLLCAGLLRQLTAAEAALLVATSVLDEVTAESANALGLSCPDRTMAALRHRRLPLAWSRDGTRMRPLPRFRGYLRKRADTMGENARRELRRRHATLLEASGRHEEAVTELLMAGEPAAARRAAEQVLPGVLDRLDLATAESWLDRMRPTPGPRPRSSCPPHCASRSAASSAGGGCGWPTSTGRPGGARCPDSPAAARTWRCCCGASGTRAGPTRPGRCCASCPRPPPRHRRGPHVPGGRHPLTPLPDLRADAAGPVEVMLMRIAYMGGRIDELQGDPAPPGAWRLATGAPGRWRRSARRDASPGPARCTRPLVKDPVRCG